MLEEDMGSQDSFHRAHVMVSDWSGAAYEYALGTLWPVLFVDTPQKIFNLEWGRVGLDSFEKQMRFEVGAVDLADHIGAGEAEDVVGALDRTRMVREPLDVDVPARLHHLLGKVGRRGEAGAGERLTG